MSAADPGHNLIVRSHAMVDPSSTTVSARWRDAAAFMETKGRLEYFEVDSSFGAGKAGDPHGGVRRGHPHLQREDADLADLPRTVPPVATRDVVPYGEPALATGTSGRRGRRERARKRRGSRVSPGL